MYQQYPDMYVFNPGGVTPIPSTMSSTNILHPELVGNLNRDNTGVLWMTLIKNLLLLFLEIVESM